MEKFDTPILYLIFNRPQMVRETFEPIKKIKPKFLYIAADGPRENNPSDQKLCQEARDEVLKNIDWDCEIKTLFREKNLGCGIAISSAINWFFDNVDSGIILEDDCLADLSFFNFSKELLERYEGTNNVFLISGNNRVPDLAVDTDYFFSAIPAAWGWATWKRAWNKYDFSMQELALFEKENKINKIFKEKKYQNYWLNFFRETRDKEINNWDMQLVFTCFNNKGLTIVPRENMVTNIGTKISNGPQNALPLHSLKIEKHPELTKENNEYDKRVMQSIATIYITIKNIFKRIGIFYLLKKQRKFSKTMLN